MSDSQTVQIKYKADSYKYQLQEDYQIQVSIIPPYNISTRFFALNEKGIMTIKAGYAWDGATGIPDRKSVMRGALVHDVLYQMIREGYLDKTYREVADATLYRLCLLDGTNEIWAWTIYHGVRLLGDPFADPSKVRPIKTAP